MMLIGLIPLFVLLFWDDLIQLRKRKYENTAGEGQHRHRAGLDRCERSGQLDSRVFTLALRQEGKVTVSDVVVETGLSVRSAEEYLDSMVDGLRVVVDYDTRGRPHYIFPELLGATEIDSGSSWSKLSADCGDPSEPG